MRYNSKSTSTAKFVAKFVAKMEDVLSVYERPYDSNYPVVYIDEKDEKNKELRGDTPGREPVPPDTPGREPVPPRPSPDKEVAHDAREDYGYKRGGMGNIFMVCEPLRGWRRVAITERRTAQDFAKQLHKLVDQDFPQAKKIVLITDNLNTHTMWSLYQTFPPQEARRILDKLEWHYTPEHGSWLNMAEIELSVLEGQCLRRRIPDAKTLEHEGSAWFAQRNSLNAKIKWQFTTKDARTKLRSLYPVIP